MTTRCAALPATVGFAIALVPLDSSGQAGRNQPADRGWGVGSQYNRLYDPDSIEMISGEVVGVEQFTPVSGSFPGVHVLVRTEGKTVNVHLGPVWYVEDRDIRLGVGDVVRVLGSSALFEGQQIIIAVEVVRGDQTLVLRYPNGVPVWSRGGGRRHPGVSLTWSRHADALVVSAGQCDL